MNSVQTQKGDSMFSFFVGSDVLEKGYTQVSRSMVILGYPTAVSEEALAKALAEGKTPTQAKEAAKEAYQEELIPLLHFEEDGIEKTFFTMMDNDMTYRLMPTQSSAYQVDDDRHASYKSIKIRWQFPFRDDFNLIQGDFLFAFGSIIFVYAYMHYHLNSSFMAAMGMLQIICSLPLAGLFYQGIFQVKFFQFLHVLTIFLVLGIGADDIFVLTDSWRNAATMVPPKSPDGVYTTTELKERMKVAYLRTASAIFNTSFTTTMAFLSCSVTKVMPMRTNGWYAALAICWNYILTITLTPAVLMIHHYRLEQKRCCCPGCSRTNLLRKRALTQNPWHGHPSIASRTREIL